jgi:hypothetical protein
MRLVLLAVTALAALALGGCPQSVRAGDSLDGDGGVGAVPPECMTNNECVAVGTSCCACPSYAVSISDPTLSACDGVGCPMPQCDDNLQATCNQGHCELECKPLACAATCANGYALDASGCLSCACAAPEGCAPGSGGTTTGDENCHAVGADCCGCALGGAETAVVDVRAHDAQLGCPPDPLCPGNNTCDPEAAVRCIADRCFLLPVADQTLPQSACGRPDLPACSGNEVCTINALTSASAQGIGVCLSPSP